MEKFTDWLTSINPIFIMLTIINIADFAFSAIAGYEPGYSLVLWMFYGFYKLIK